MTILALVAVAAALNPFRARGRVVCGDRRAAVLAATVATAVVVAVLAGGAGSILDAAGLGSGTARLAAGIVALLAGAVALVRRPAPVADAPPGWRGGLIPLAFPVLLTPELGVLAVAVGARDGAMPATVTAATVAALAALAATTPPPGGRSEAVWAGLGRVVAAVLLVAGVGIGVDGALSV